MYTIREVSLQHGAHERKRSVITFNEQKMKIFGEFLMSDAPLMSFAIIHDIELVLQGVEKSISRNGNRCTTTITQDRIYIEDLYTDLYEGLHTYRPCSMDTNEALLLIQMWKKHLEQYE